MTSLPSNTWFSVFPSARIPEVLAYVNSTWDWLRHTFAVTVAFDHDETALTDNLCEALSDQDRRFANGMDCDFLSETWELRRGADGTITRIARADIRVILGVPSTPHLVLEFKKLGGSANDRWKYCFEGMKRFVEGKYAVGHAFGVMCGFSPNNLTAEATAMAAYIAQERYARRLSCIPDASGNVVTAPSPTNPAWARFDTNHKRPSLTPDDPIVLLHTFLPCPPAAAPVVKPQRGRSRSRKPKTLSKGA